MAYSVIVFKTIAKQARVPNMSWAFQAFQRELRKKDEIIISLREQLNVAHRQLAQSESLESTIGAAAVTLKEQNRQLSDSLWEQNCEMRDLRERLQVCEAKLANCKCSENK